MSKKLPNVPIPKEELNKNNLHDLSKERDERCTPIAQEILRTIGNQKEIPLGSHIAQSGMEDSYRETVNKLLTLMVEKNIPVTDLVYIFNLTREAISIVQETLETTFNENMNRITEAVYGLEYGKAHTIGVGDLAKVVKHGAEIKDTWKDALNK
jgi:hypothetical protein